NAMPREAAGPPTDIGSSSIRQRWHQATAGLGRGGRKLAANRRAPNCRRAAQHHKAMFQHVVAQSYLRPFADSTNRVKVIEQGKLLRHPRSIRKVGGEDSFYSVSRLTAGSTTASRSSCCSEQTRLEMTCFNDYAEANSRFSAVSAARLPPTWRCKSRARTHIAMRRSGTKRSDRARASGTLSSTQSRCCGPWD